MQNQPITYGVFPLGEGKGTNTRQMWGTELGVIQDGGAQVLG